MDFKRLEEIVFHFSFHTKPNISWSYEGHQLEDSAFFEYLDRGVLQLRNVTMRSEGGYVCNAFNDIGSTQKVFYIIVNGSKCIISSITSK